MKIIIPARYNSSRFPGKPLIKLKGITMIRRVWDKAILAINKKNVYITTESEIIMNHCKEFTENVILTNDNCITGTDRVAECAKKIKADYVINIQGDEPLIDHRDIKNIIELAKKNKNIALNCMIKIKNQKEFISRNIPKVITDKNNNLIYMSRSPVPYDNYKASYKQVCIYYFPKNALKYYGQKKNKSKNEIIEDIEILRLLDNNVKVKMIETFNQSYAIDTKFDIKKVIKLI